MTYRDRPGGYDIARWQSGTSRKRERRPETKWLLLFGMGLVAFCAIRAVMPGEGDTFPNVVVVMPLLIAATQSPFARAPWLTASGRARYDEFERAAYARATAIAFVVLVLLVAGAFAWLAAASAWRLAMPHDPRQWATWGIAALLIGAAMPLLLAEFIVPPPPPRETWDE